MVTNSPTSQKFTKITAGGSNLVISIVSAIEGCKLVIAIVTAIVPQSLTITTLQPQRIYLISAVLWSTYLLDYRH